MLLFYEPSKENGYEKVEVPSGKGTTLIFSEGFTRDDAAYLVESFEVTKHTLDDIFDVDELPRVESDDNFEYVYLRNLEVTGNKTTSHPLLFIIGEALFACVSINKQPTDGIMALQNGNDKLPTNHRRLLVRGVSTIVKHYEEIIDDIGGNIQTIEKRMRSHEADNRDFFSFVGIESSLNRANMNLVGLSTVAEKLMTAAKTKPERELFDDIILYSRQLIVEIDSHLKSIKSVREAYSTVANNTLNQRMKMLTALTLLMAIPNVFFGMYGMNIALPFMDQPWAYPAVVGFSALIIITVYVVARRHRFF